MTQVIGGWAGVPNHLNADGIEVKELDGVNHPAHYTFGKYEVIDVLQDWFPDNPLLWQVGKYIARAEHKGKMVQDLEKAKWYLQREIERLTK